MDKNLKLIKPLTTEEVFEIWRDIEENLEHWKHFWRAKGHKSWSEWRKSTHKAVLKEKLDWNLYEVVDPLKIIPEWHGGMFYAWNKWFYINFKQNPSRLAESEPPKLKDLLAHPGVHNHWYIRAISKKFPKKTTLSAIRLKNGKIFIIEGMHRACSIAAIAHNKRIFKSKVYVVLANWPKQKLPKLGTGWKK